MTRSVPPPRLPTPGSHRGYNAGTYGNGGQVRGTCCGGQSPHATVSAGGL